MDADYVFKQWEQHINAGNLFKVVGLYAKDAVLLGTFSKIICNSPDLIRKYFIEIFRRKNLRVTFSSMESRCYSEIYLYSGTYEFSYEDKELITIPARFTYAIGKDETGNYKIVEHHSSLIPN